VIRGRRGGWVLRHQLEATVAPSFLADRAAHRVLPFPLLVTSAARSTRIEGHMTNLPDEIWKPVVGREGEYEVSDQGRVRSLERRVRLVTKQAGETTRRVPSRLLRPGPSRSGHLSVAIGKGNSRLVHQLVLEAFIGPRPNECEVLHKNGDPADNRLDNLRYGTRSENLEDIFYHKGRALNREQIAFLRKRAAEGFRFGERYQLALAWGVNPGTIHHVVKGKEYGHVKT
jgi:hypothetical protein